MRVLASAIIALLLVAAVAIVVAVDRDGPAGPDGKTEAEAPADEGDGAATAPPEADVPDWVSEEIRALVEALLRMGAEGPNPYQEGENGDCLDFNGFYNLGPVESPLAARIEVDPGTGFVSDSTSGWAHVDFFDEDGDWLGWNDGSPNGNVPDDAAYGIMCVALRGGYPDVPEPFANWFYMDGFPEFG